jgi:hypothetical protein
MSEARKAVGELFIVDNSDNSWKGLKYLHDWTEIASAFDIATGFKDVREDVWNFHIGAYQVCRKWLKDGKARTLTGDDSSHCQRNICHLS